MPIKYLRWTEIGLFTAGVIVWGFSIESGNSWMTTLGITSIGLGLLLSGFTTMATGELTMWRGRYGVTRDRGLSARLFGLVLGLIGGALLAVAAARVIGLDDRLVAFLGDRPGFAMVPVGILSLALGAANLVGAWNRRGSLSGVFVSLKNWLGGLLFVAIGLILVGVGLYEVAAPQAFDDLLNSLFQPISTSHPGL
jgi:hypothetical protein